MVTLHVSDIQLPSLLAPHLDLPHHKTDPRVNTNSQLRGNKAKLVRRARLQRSIPHRGKPKETQHWG